MNEGMNYGELRDAYFEEKGRRKALQDCLRWLLKDNKLETEQVQEE